MLYRAAVLAFLLTVFSAPAFCQSVVRLVIKDGEFGHYLSHRGAISRVPEGRVVSVSFRYADYDFRHPHLIADRFCVNGRFIRWGSAQHPLAGPIDLVCIKGSQTRTTQMGSVGN
jgi:hypothetical protein